ncbi:MAG: MFS transporter [Burkholderiales bacterium]
MPMLPPLLPPGTLHDARVLLWTRGIRAFGDGYISLLLPYYLTLLGFDAFQVGIIITATLFGAGGMTLTIGLIAHRYRARSLLMAGSALLAVVALLLAHASDFWPLLIIAAFGVLNPASGDVTVFAPLEHSMLARSGTPQSRTALFARYSVVGSLVGALGAQAAGVPALLGHWLGLTPISAVQMMFLAYALLGICNLLLYRSLSPRIEAPSSAERAPLHRSKRIVYKLAALFSIDAFGGGFAVQSLIALWLFHRFELSIATASTIFFWTNILAAISFLIAARIAARFGLINTMVFTHLPANIFLILVPLMPTLPLAILFLCLRSALSQMDVPVRSSYVMAVVSPEERAAAASVTAVPRSFAAAISPSFAGYLLTLSPFGWPLVICGALKIVYDLLLLGMFRAVRPPEERREPPHEE